MTKKRMIDWILVAAVIVFLSAGAFLVRSWSGPNSVAYIRTSGDAVGGCGGGCGGCSSDVSRNLRCRPGVAWVQHDKAQGMTLVAFDNAAVKPQDLVTAYRERGVDSRMERIVSLEQYYRTCRSSGDNPDCGKPCGGNCSTVR
ncbi:hypothetical protein [Geobacter sp. DSM 9736]|uniref:hypothetical protein n=1 Tax=Geobacter sp. DSM 9736 TaxID=1277350 RepID=UPI000B50C483|nr:hypothetical protein [Geobacter sp. DSM 9736]SNB45970.1 Copper chaperone CopZ [Geobacter sp. DSM 9736]